MLESVCFLNQTQNYLETKAHSVISTKIAEVTTSVLMYFQPVDEPDPLTSIIVKYLW